MLFPPHRTIISFHVIDRDPRQSLGVKARTVPAIWAGVARLVVPVPQLSHRAGAHSLHTCPRSFRRLQYTIVYIVVPFTLFYTRVTLLHCQRFTSLPSPGPPACTVTTVVVAHSAICLTVVQSVSFNCPPIPCITFSRQSNMDRSVQTH